MNKFSIKPLSNIAQVGLEKLNGTSCMLDEASESPDGLLVRSTKLNSDNLTENLKSISRAGAGVNNIPVAECSAQPLNDLYKSLLYAACDSPIALCTLLYAHCSMHPVTPCAA